MEPVIYKENKKEYKVLTPDGYKSFAGIRCLGQRPIFRVEFENNYWLECTDNHKIFVNDTTRVPVSELKVGDNVLSIHNNVKILSIVDTRETQLVYDLIEVDGGHRYYTNGVLSSNCEFLIYDETLISSIKLADLEGRDPFMKIGQFRWYKKVKPRCTYIVALDPSLGTGGDPAAIQVIEIPTFEQVAEWQHNLTTVQGQARLLRDVCTYINTECQNKGAPATIYFSVENNTVGEAALVAISEMGEESIPGLFLSEPIKKGHIRRFRRGFNTTHSSKISICAKLKHLIETDQLKINSKPLISELKTYVAKGFSFEGKNGGHDDLVSSLLLALRMIMQLQDWDPVVYEKMRADHAEEELIAPMPIYVNTFG